jgi:hypothetical protein
VPDENEKKRKLARANEAAAARAEEAAVGATLDLVKQILFLPGANTVVDVDLNITQHMSPAAAETIQKVAEQTYAIPAREQTKRAWLVTARHFGTLAFAVFVVVYVLPKLTGDPLVIAKMGALAMVIYGVIRIIKVVKGRDD